LVWFTVRAARLVVFVFAVGLHAFPARSADAQSAPSSPPRSGSEIYQRACAACHGIDGRGNPQAVVGFDVALPDFTDCVFATVESAEGWHAVVHEGGPVRALDRHMPAFGQALSDEEIDLAVAHVRTFCKSRGYPRGDLNLPRAMLTEKAFPENEALYTMSFNRDPSRSISNGFVYERRFGARNQYEVNVPFTLQQGESNRLWARGLGDVAVAVKRVLFADVDQGTIVSAGEEIALPTGKQSEGLGSGFTTFESWGAFGQMLPRMSFVQLHAGIGIPSDSTRAAKEAFWRAAIGKTFTAPAYGRIWTPMVEVVGARSIEAGAASEWDVVPQMQVSLSKRRHIMVSGGVQLPITERDARKAQVLTYFLWDWYEGGLFDGWR
jgi:mono/diheme cytochrome c family protein